MRPISIISATLYGVLWVSAGTTAQVTEGGDGPNDGVDGARTSTTAAATTTTLTTAAASSSSSTTTDYIVECAFVYQYNPQCMAICRTAGVETVTQLPSNSCTRAVTTAVSDPGVTSVVNVVYPNLIGVMVTTSLTVVNNNPLYFVTRPEGYGPSFTTKTATRTRFVNPATQTASAGDVLGSDSGAVATDASATPASTTLVSAGSASSGKKTNAGAIAGGVVGGVLGLALIVAVIFFLHRRRKNASKPHDTFSSLEKSRGESSPQSTTPQIPITSYDPPPAPAPQQQPQPESQHSLMGAYSPPGGTIAGKHPTEVEVDEDGVSLRSPSPPLEGETSRGRDYVPRLPIYNRGSDETPRGSAL